MIFPYLELPLAIGYDGQSEKVVKGMFQPSNITAYHEGYFDVGIFIYQEGQPFQIALSMSEYETKIRAYWDMVNSKRKLGIVK